MAIVDDEALIRQGLSLILAAAPDIEVVGAVEGGEALALIEMTRPDVVLLDIRMPDVDGLTILGDIQARRLESRVVILTTFDSDEHIETAMRAGASGFLLKDTDPEQLPQYVRTAAGGGVVLVPSVSSAILGFSARPAATAEYERLISTLTPREISVLTLLAEGYSNGEIGSRLFLSIGTIKDHVSAILAKLDVPTRVQAALIADRAGLLRAPDRS